MFEVKPCYIALESRIIHHAHGSVLAYASMVKYCFYEGIRRYAELKSVWGDKGA